MKLLIYVEPTTYLIPLWHQIRGVTDGAVQMVFLEEDLSQSWGLHLHGEPGVTVLRGSRWAKFKALRRLISDPDVDLVHLAGWGHPLLIAALLAARMRGIAVSMESDTPLPMGTPAWKRACKRVMYPALFRLPAVFLPGGAKQAGYLRHYGVSPARIRVAQMTVDVAAISAHADRFDAARRAQLRARLGLPDDALVFTYVGRLEPHKGIAELLGAFALQSAAPGPVRLLIVGDGSMEETVTTAAVGDARICYTGRLSGSALLDAYVAADVFVLPSRFEPWGLVVNEAMACGLPVIATDRVGCVGDLVIDGETGLLVPAESAIALANAMFALRQAPSLLAKMRRNARALIADWTIQNEAEIMISTWKQMAAA